MFETSVYIAIFSHGILLKYLQYWDSILHGHMHRLNIDVYAYALLCVLISLERNVKRVEKHFPALAIQSTAQRIQH